MPEKETARPSLLLNSCSRNWSGIILPTILSFLLFFFFNHEFSKIIRKLYKSIPKISIYLLNCI